MRKSSNSTGSRQIVSSQTAIHDKLANTVARHLRADYRRPHAQHNIDAFDQAVRWLAERSDGSATRIILDSFCGVGESSAALAQRFPDCAVIGVDKSAARLAKHGHYRAESADNYLLLRSDVDDFWRLAVDAGWQLERHFLLYPNPWPKPGQLKYRVHGSPLFASLLALGGKLELRSNWRLYIDEFAAALAQAGHNGEVAAFTSDRPITPFERKYREAKQSLWRLQCQL